jgi:tetratricopeptide (TPR) repeat protein
MDDQRLSINRRALVILLMGVTLTLAWHHLSKLDGRFFRPSVHGVIGLILYEAGDYSGAADAYRAHLQEAYQTERQSADPAWNALLTGDPKTAADVSEQRARSNPRDVDALLNLAELALDRHDLETAHDYSGRVLRVQVDQYDARLLSSIAYAKAGKYDDAIVEMNRALRHARIETRPTTFLRVLNMTGELERLDAQERPRCLLATYRRYLRIFDPSQARAVKSYAWEAIQAGDHADYAYVDLGVVADKEGNEAQALGWYRKAIETNPNNVFALTSAGLLYSDRGDLTNEYNVLKAAYENAPGDSYVAFAYSHLLAEQMADYRDAVAVAQSSVELDPENPELLRRAAFLFQFMGQYDKALAHYQHTVQLDPSNAKAYAGMAWIFYAIDNSRDEAIVSYNKALAIDPAMTDAYIGLGSIYASKGDMPRSIGAYEQAFQFGEKNTNMLANLCSVYFEAGLFQKAADCSAAVLAMDPRNTWAAKIHSFALQNLPKVAAR